MPSISDVYNQLQDANGKLDTLNSDLLVVANRLTTIDKDLNSGFTDTVNTLNAGFSTLTDGVDAVITLQEFANQVLLYHSKQYDTMICILEKISRNTCNLVTEAHIQTGLQTSIEKNVHIQTELLKSANPAVTLELERLESLRKQIEKCCPPKPEAPACSYEPCKTNTFTQEAPKPEL